MCTDSPARKRRSTQLLALAQAEDQLAAEHVHGLVLDVVVLAAQHVARLHVQNLADVAVGPGPDQLIAPGLLDPIRRVRHHPSTIRRLNDEGDVMHSRTHTPQPTHPSILSTGCPASSMERARSPTGQASAQTRHGVP